MKVKDLANQLIKQAVKEKASDIFIFPKSENYEISIRKQSKSEFIEKIDLKQGSELLSYFKFIAQMDIAEHRRPQVGALNYDSEKDNIFLRFSSSGDFLNKEALVIRVIYSIQTNNYFFQDQFQKMLSLCSKRGLIVTSGPTGSGKTSTMYNLARTISDGKVVMTIEDPVEIFEPSFLQTQVNLGANIKYIDLMKAALRNRPDILIIGEIRDSETAKVAVNAALSGHLVLATVHAKSSLQTLSRLEGLGITKSELYNSLTAVSYQRLMVDQKNNYLSCLLDIASGSDLLNEINRNNRHDFITWKDSLQILRKEERISDETFARYEQG